MPTTFTSLLGLSLPATGELAGTWGTTVNDGITSLLDAAIAGTTTLSTDADVTLTTTTGAANQARQQILLCTGSRAAQRTVIAPAQSKTYTVINSTTGGFGVRVAGVGPTTGVVVAAGERAFISWNGSDFVKVGNSFGAGVATRIPFFDGTGALTSAADFVRDASGNVGIGTTAPGARLEISTNASNALRITKPTPSQLPSYIQDTSDLSNITLQAGSTAGFFSSVEVMGWNGTGSNPRVALYTAGTERLRIDASGHQINSPGNTTPPTLTVNGQFNLTPTSNTNLRISYRGTDGVTRVANITLA